MLLLTLTNHHHHHHHHHHHRHHLVTQTLSNDPTLKGEIDYELKRYERLSRDKAQGLALDPVLSQGPALDPVLTQGSALVTSPVKPSSSSTTHSQASKTSQRETLVHPSSMTSPEPKRVSFGGPRSSTATATTPARGSTATTVATPAPASSTSKGINTLVTNRSHHLSPGPHTAFSPNPRPGASPGPSPGPSPSPCGMRKMIMSPSLKQALASPRIRAVAHPDLALDSMRSPVSSSTKASTSRDADSASASASARARATAAILGSPQLIRALVPLGNHSHPPSFTFRSLLSICTCYIIPFLLPLNSSFASTHFFHFLEKQQELEREQGLLADLKQSLTLAEAPFAPGDTSVTAMLLIYPFLQSQAVNLYLLPFIFYFSRFFFLLLFIVVFIDLM